MVLLLGFLLLADNFEFGAKCDELAFKRFALFTEGLSVFRIVSFESGFAIDTILYRIGDSPHIFLHLYPRHQRFSEFSRAEHRRNMLGFHPVKPNIVNVLIYVYSYIVDVHYFKNSNTKYQY